MRGESGCLFACEINAQSLTHTHTHTPACAQKRFVKRAAARWVITRHHFPSAFFCEWSSLCMQPPRSSIHKQRSLLFPAACVDPTPTQRKWPQTVKRMDYKMDGYLDQQVPYPLANVRMSQRFLLLYSINVFGFFCLVVSLLVAALFMFASRLHELR